VSIVYRVLHQLVDRGELGQLVLARAAQMYRLDDVTAADLGDSDGMFV
jgi:hypothetical protein